jgi:hypothetical protein
MARSFRARRARRSVHQTSSARPFIRGAILIAAAIAIAAGGSAAPDAHADPNDEQFLNTLTLHELGCTQISFLNCGPSGEQSLIDLGKDICATMRSHHMSEATACDGV